MYTFIVNPAAGSGRTEQIAAMIKETAERYGKACRICKTEWPGHATELARQAAMEAGCEGVIAVGGDGTAYETACGLLDSNMPMGMIPTGTGNDFIKTLGLPQDVAKAIEWVFTHAARPIDVGRLNDRLFLNVSGTGFDVQVLDSMASLKGHMRGILPYLIGVVRAIFRYKPVHVIWTVDGKTREEDVLLCAVANGRCIGGGIPICPDAQPDDGLLDFVLVADQPRWKLPFYLPGLLMGKVLRFPFTTHQQCREVEIASPRLRLNVDGEILSMERASFTVLPGRLKMFW